MGEAVLFPGTALGDGRVQLGPLLLAGTGAAPSGPVRVAVRPEAWQIRPAGQGGLAAMLQKSAYLGSIHEYTFATALGPVFVASADVGTAWQVGQAVSLGLADHGYSVVVG